MVHDTGLRVALTHALSALVLSLVHLKLVAVVECLVTHTTARLGAPLCIRRPLLLALLLTLQRLLLLKVRFGVRVKVKVEGAALVEILVSLWDRVAVILNLLNLVKVLF